MTAFWGPKFEVHISNSVSTSNLKYQTLSLRFWRSNFADHILNNKISRAKILGSDFKCQIFAVKLVKQILKVRVQDYAAIF